jgi:hypothetical protein
MKIGVFGDSFANHRRNSSPTWVDILSETYSVDNYAEPGSSLFFSVDNFKRRHERYDKIIFCITGPERLMLPERSKIKYKNLNCNIKFNTAEWLLNSSDASKKDKIIAKAVYDYYIHVQNNEYDRYVHKLMIDNIKRTRPDGIFIDGIGDLNQVCHKENDHYNKIDNIEKYTDLRNCHLTETNNRILAEEMKKALETGIYTFDVTPFNLEPNEPFEKYFV